jgi:TusA-related sulfurtransferase
MAGRKRLNLLDVAEPICLLICKRTIEQMRQGEVLEVFMRDPEAVEDLVKVVARSPDEVLGVRRQGEHFRIEIRRRR